MHNCRAGSFVLTAGSLRWSGGTETTKQVVTATTSFRHPDYNALFVDNDIGIIRPSAAFAFNDSESEPDEVGKFLTSESRPLVRYH